MYNGVINVYKEAGFTSHDVVAKLRGICGQKKIGHTGTLDPQAVGVLPVCLGNATKLCDMLTDKDKEYIAKLLLGVTTDTQDMEGTILSKQEVMVTGELVSEAILSFQGEYDQVPPMYSALKVNGKRLYELARAGKEVERKARRVEIKEIEILEMNLPEVTFRVVCSKGTYIRSLCADIGDRLSCGGAMKSLIRSRSGEFTQEQARTLSQIQKLKDEGNLDSIIIPVEQMFHKLPALTVKKDMQRLLENGNAIRPEQTFEQVTYEAGQRVRFYMSDNTFAGIYAFSEERGFYQPVKMFLDPK